MQALMSSNIYDVDKTIVVMGSCLQQVSPYVFNMIKKQYDRIYTLCLEETHINMAITKIGSMIRTNKIKEILFVSVDKSPHCVQMHYIQDELNKMMDLSKISIKNYIVDTNVLIPISKKTISLSKNLQKLEEMISS